MKLVRILAVFIACMVFAAPVNGSGSAKKSLTLLYQGDFKGYVEGCG